MVPQMRKAGVDKAFKYISLQIGSNDLCSVCGEDNPGNHQRTYSLPRFGMLTLILRKMPEPPLLTPLRRVSGKSDYK